MKGIQKAQKKSKESADNGINNPVKSKLDEFARNNLVDNKTTRPNIKSVARLAKKQEHQEHLRINQKQQVEDLKEEK